MVSSEFGRTPKINKDAGRDHWPKVFSVVLAGGGDQEGLRLRRLQRHGHRARDATRSAPKTSPRPSTTSSGIVADKELMAPGNRPIEIVDGGKVRTELLG